MKISKTENLRTPSTGLRRKRDQKDPASRLSLYNQEKRYEVVYIKITDLKPFKNQSRIIFDEDEIQKLADTIQQHGIRSPLTIKTSDDDDKFEIVSGERRFRAAKIVGLKRLPCIIVENEKDAEEIALIENIHRKDLHPIELGRTFKKLLENNLFKTQEELSSKLGIPRTKVTEFLTFSKLPLETQEYLLEKKIDQRHYLRKITKLENTSVEDIKKVIGEPPLSKSEIKNHEKTKTTLLNVSLINGKLKVNNKDIKDYPKIIQDQMANELKKILRDLEE